MHRIRKWNITEGIWLTRWSWENSKDMLRKSNFTTISYIQYVTYWSTVRGSTFKFFGRVHKNWLGCYNLNLIISACIHFLVTWCVILCIKNHFRIFKNFDWRLQHEILVKLEFWTKNESKFLQNYSRFS
jgi:hypothetical protein